MKKITYKQYGEKNWGYRFETARINGKRHWEDHRGFATQKEARKAAEALYERHMREQQTFEISHMSLSDYLDYWLNDLCSGQLQQNTVYNYRKKIQNYIKPELGKYPICCISHEQIQKFIDKMYNRGFAINTLNTVRGILSKAFNDAVNDQKLLRSPADRIHIPQNVAPKVPTRAEPHIYIPQDKMKKIFERFPEGSVAYLPLRLGYECGLRIGETFALCWEDIDFEKKCIKISRQVQWFADKSRTSEEKAEARRNGNRHKEDHGYWYLKHPKSKSSIRDVDISDDLADLLLRTKKAQEKAENYYEESYTRYYTDRPLPSDNAPFEIPILEKGQYPLHLVMIRENGTYITQRTIQHASAVIKKSICPNFDYHSLRGTHATMLREQGFDDLYITCRLGHSKMEITAQYYERLSGTIIQQGKDKLNRMFSAV